MNRDLLRETDLALMLRVLDRSGQRHKVTHRVTTVLPHAPREITMVEVWSRREGTTGLPSHFYFDEASGALLDFCS